MELVCEPVFDYGRVPATWSIVDEAGHVAEATGGDVTMRLHTDLRVGVEGGRVRGRHVLEAGDRLYCALSWAADFAAPADAGDAAGAGRRDGDVLAAVVGPGPDPRSPLPGADPALGAGHQGSDLHADGRHRGGADGRTAGDARRRAQLGLPLQLDARLDVHPAGVALAEPGLGGRRVHAVRRRPRAQRRRRHADHVRHRRAPRPQGVDARPPQRLQRRPPGADRQRRVRPAPERRVRRRARRHPAPLAAQPAPAPAAVAARAGPGRRARRRCGPSRTRASGRPAARRSTTCRRS